MELQVSEPQGRTATAIVSFPVANLDAGNVKDFRAAIEDVAGANRTLLLDMSRLTFVDSSGLGALLSILRTMRNKKGHLLLFGLTKPVRALFELVRMHRIFSIHETRDEALAALEAA